MKDRDISVLDFFYALQREYICLEIRAKIYISGNDKDYFRRLIEKKRKTIMFLSEKNGLPNIIQDRDEYLKVWKEIVPPFGFPRFIYNINNVSEEQLSFPYAGSVVKCGKDKFGMTHLVNFKDNTVDVVLVGDDLPTTFPRKEVKRLSHMESDEYFYFQPFNNFKCEERGIGNLETYSMNSKICIVCFEGKSLALHRDKVARIL